MSVATSFYSHRLPPGAYPQNYNPRYADATYPLMRDAHEENPESILDDHVRRVMKTPGCQSPGTGRHSPKSRSPDGLPGGKGMGLGMALTSGQGKHQSRHGLKGDTSHLYHHKHVHHIHHTGVGKPREQVEAEAAMRVHGGFPWSAEASHYGSKSRSYADGMGSSSMEHAGYRYAPTISTISFFENASFFWLLTHLLFFFHYSAAKVAHSVKERSRKVRRCGLMTCRRLQRRWRKTRRSFCGWWKDRRKWFNIRGARTGQWWHLTFSFSLFVSGEDVSVSVVQGERG